jgi:hypothetical protein
MPQVPAGDDGVNYVYDEMPTLRSDGHEDEAPGSIHVRILWLEIVTNDCQQVERLILEQAVWLRELAGKPVGQ